MDFMITTEGMQNVSTPTAPALEVCGARAVFREDGRAVFAISARHEKKIGVFLHGSIYSAATGFMRGEFDVEGDLVRAIQWRMTQPRSAVREAVLSLAAGAARTCYSVTSSAARNIRFHYDHPNRFYQTFLDPRMVYSCAYFRSPSDSLEDAQAAKLDHICRKLHLQAGDRFLDVGCGWGGLIFHAFEQYGAVATGCTLSHSQAEFIGRRLAASSALTPVTVLESDFQKVDGRFDKIASIGMFEHVGHRRLHSYFSHISNLLTEQGLFLNHANARPQNVDDGPETLFLQKYVFPGGDLLHISEVIAAAEDAGFETLDVENLRPHYALTCRAWVSRLQSAAAECLQTVPREVYRSWLLYLAACAVSFENAGTDIYQALFAKRSRNQQRQLTRDYIYS